MSMLKKTLIYLGLGPDEEYDAFDDYAPNPEAAAPAATAAGRPTMRAVSDAPPVQSSTVRPIVPSRPEPSGSVRVVPSDAAPARTAAPAAASGAWPLRWWAGKALHLGRLAKGAFTFTGGARYLIWKIRRHRKR